MFIYIDKFRVDIKMFFKMGMFMKKSFLLLAMGIQASLFSMEKATVNNVKEQVSQEKLLALCAVPLTVRRPSSEGSPAITRVRRQSDPAQYEDVVNDRAFFRALSTLRENGSNPQ